MFSDHDVGGRRNTRLRQRTALQQEVGGGNLQAGEQVPVPPNDDNERSARGSQDPPGSDRPLEDLARPGVGRISGGSEGDGREPGTDGGGEGRRQSEGRGGGRGRQVHPEGQESDLARASSEESPRNAETYLAELLAISEAGSIFGHARPVEPAQIPPQVDQQRAVPGREGRRAELPAEDRRRYGIRRSAGALDPDDQSRFEHVRHPAHVQPNWSDSRPSGGQIPGRGSTSAPVSQGARLPAPHGTQGPARRGPTREAGVRTDQPRYTRQAELGGDGPARGGDVVSERRQ